jgi:hypothetical protein
MTYQEAETLCLCLPEIDNPRFIACYAALGREPTMFEFTAWAQDKWTAFGGYRNKIMEIGYERTHKEFNKFIGVPDDNG